jgi:NADPH:quinone reductase-like Zn-dependent oxidoreductase
MQAAGVDAFGGQVHTLELEAPGSPAPDEVVISVHAAGVANWDEFVRTGDWDVGREPPLALGVEAAGVVAAVGEDVRSLAAGDQVLTHPVPLRHQGAWAQWLLAPAALVARKPAVVGWEAAAAFPVPALTGDPPPPERGVEVIDVYVRADGARLAALVETLAHGRLSLHVAATRPLAQAATALQDAVAGRASGASVLTLQQSPS